MYECVACIPTCQRPQLGSHDDQFVFWYQIGHLICANSCVSVYGCMYVYLKEWYVCTYTLICMYIQCMT